jgi:Arc/MetJ-type ribon-helix-helix transcriptional regulator
VASPITLRLDEATRRRIVRIARQRRTSTSHVLREAIRTWVDREESGISAYESIKDLIGIAHGGEPTLSTNTGRRLTEMLKARRRQA